MTNYCPELFRTMYVQKLNENEVKLGHCCISARSELTSTVDMHHEFLKKGRVFYLEHNKLPPACNICVDLENKGVNTPRLDNLKNITQEVTVPKLEMLFYNCDPICNLKCIMCGGEWSSSWIEDEVKLGIRSDLKINHTKNNNLYHDMDLSNLTAIHFNGGEPFMTQDHLNLLAFVCRTRTAKNIGVSYNTNATWPITQEILDMWAKFGGVTVYCSIDGTHEVFDYVRYGDSWQNVEANIKSYQNIKLEHFQIKIAAAIGLHNILYVDELYSWADQNNLELTLGCVTHHLEIKNFPFAAKQQLISYLHSLPGTTNTQIILSAANAIDENSDLSWLYWIKNLDRIRGNNWRQSLRKLYELDSEYFDSI